MGYHKHRIEKTVFNLEIATRIAETSYRTKRPGPWVGKEEQLLDALWLAEAAHAAWLPGVIRHGHLRSLVSKLKKKNGLLRKLCAVHGAWNNLTPDERTQFALETENVGDARPVAVTLEEIERVFDNLCHTGLFITAPGGGYKGPIQKLYALQIFVQYLRGRWETHCPVAFSVEFDRQLEGDNSLIPVSAASKLVWAAVQELENGYTVKNCEYVMRPR